MTSPAPATGNYDQQQLAAARTRMANERTFLTYLRTSLALVGFGLALIQLHPLRGAGLRRAGGGRRGAPSWLAALSDAPARD